MEDEFDIVYRQLFRKYYANLLFYATRMVGEEDAEDVVQDVFEKLLNYSGRFESEEHLTVSYTHLTLPTIA